MPQRGLKDVVERRLDALVGDVVLPDEAEDRRVERCDVPFPIGERALAVLGPFVGNFGEAPGGRVVDDIFDELIEVAANARAHT